MTDTTNAHFKSPAHKQKTESKTMTQIALDIHLHSFFLGMASSFAIVLTFYALRHEVRMWKKRKQYETQLQKKRVARKRA